MDTIVATTDTAGKHKIAMTRKWFYFGLSMLAVWVAGFVSLVCGGCTTLIVSRTEDANGSPIVKVEYYSFGKDKSVEELTVPTSAGPATVRGGASNVNPAVNDIAAAARALTERAVAP